MCTYEMCYPILVHKLKALHFISRGSRHGGLLTCNSCWLTSVRVSKEYHGISASKCRYGIIMMLVFPHETMSAGIVWL